MHLPPLLLFLLWSCFALSLAAFVPLGYIMYHVVDDGPEDLPSLISFGIGQLVVIALMTCSLLLLGHSLSALWVWRILNIIASILCVGGCLVQIRNRARQAVDSLPSQRNYDPRSFRSRLSNPVGLLVTFAVSAVTVFFSVCSVLVHALPNAGASAGQQFSADSAGLTQLSFWHAALYIILALAIVVCGVLFISASRNEGPLSFERNGGGLGVGSGNWEVSNSLTYLIATVALAALLLGLITHKDAIDQEREQRHDAAVAASTAAAAASAAQKPPPALTPAPLTSPKTLNGKPASEPANPDGADTHGH